MRHTFLHLTLSLVAFLLSTPGRADPLQQLPAESIGKIATAAADIVKTRPGGQGGVAFELAVDRAIGYRLGDGMVVIIPDKSLVTGQSPAARSVAPVAVIVTSDISVGDFRKMVAMNQALPITAPGEPPNMGLWLVNLTTSGGSRTLEVYGAGNAAAISMPARLVRSTGATPIGLRASTERFLELTFTVNGTITAMIRLGPASPIEAPASLSSPEDFGERRPSESGRRGSGRHGG
jgi:hypothetical protein